MPIPLVISKFKGKKKFKRSAKKLKKIKPKKKFSSKENNSLL
jgi:hypothetical protein